MAVQVSDVLDNLLQSRGYNKQVRPDNLGDGSPAVVELNLAIQNIGPIDELKEVFSIDCYFRQTWYDARLQFNSRFVSRNVEKLKKNTINLSPFQWSISTCPQLEIPHKDLEARHDFFKRPEMFPPQNHRPEQIYPSLS